MINQRFRLVDTQNIRTDFVEEDIQDSNLFVRPLYMAICAADQRYYQGLRPPEIMKKKLPLALIHEAVGEIMYDPKRQCKKGTKVVLIPNCPLEKDKNIKDNYLSSTKFSSSSKDGFMQEIVSINRGNVVTINDLDLKTASLLELTSVGMNAIEAFKNHAHTPTDTLGVWGDGSVGFILALTLKFVFPKSRIVLFGKNEHKLNFFTFVDYIYNIYEYPESLKIDHAFECVGGSKSSNAINQIVDIVNPQGVISLLGVSEYPVDINTRMVLEKGLTLIGNSRSSYVDYVNSVNLFKENTKVPSYLNTIISDELLVKNVPDIHNAFSTDFENEFKTIMKWEI
jgi:ribitol-5-phosphate 2-dehydrogenase